MERTAAVPGNRLGEFLRQQGEPVARPLFARAIANDQDAARSNTTRQMVQKRSLFRRRKIVEDVEERDVAGEFRNRFLDVVETKIDVAIISLGNTSAIPNFPGIDIQPDDRLAAAAFAQIKRQKSHP